MSERPKLGCGSTVLLLAALMGFMALVQAMRGPSPRPAPPPAVVLAPGVQLIDRDGQVWGVVKQVSDRHIFPNGKVEPGILVDYGPRMGNTPVPPQWWARRAADNFTLRAP